LQTNLIIMNSLQLISKLKGKSDDLNINIKQILSNDTSFSMLEKELLKKQCTDLFELILKLKTEEQEQLISNPPLVQTIKQDEPIEPKIEKVIAPIEVTDFKELIKDFSSEITLDEVIVKAIEPIEEKPAIAEPSRPAEPAFTTAPKEHAITPKHEFPIEINIEKATENKRILKTVMPEITEKPSIPLNEAFKERGASYNDKISKETINPIVEKTLESPVDSIKSAITLNKKIAFVNELFNKNVFEYAKSIDRLNQAIDLNDALRIHSELKHQNSWTNDNELVIELERIIRRRFTI